MKKTALTTANHRVVAYVTVDARGVHTITDYRHRVLGYYDPRTNRTTNRTHRIVGYGYQLPRLVGGLDERLHEVDHGEDLLAEVKPQGPTKPKAPVAPQSGGIPPMTPKQARKEATRKQNVQDKISKERQRSSERQAELRAQLSRKPT